MANLAKKIMKEKERIAHFEEEILIQKQWDSKGTQEAQLSLRDKRNAHVIKLYDLEQK